jgi:DNA (cytosine-5)-methyltransferase 1
MSRPRLLDLYSCAGGAAMGYSRAGFEVVGVDLVAQPRYPFEFVQGDALEEGARLLATGEFAAVHASPPCQIHSTMTKRHGPEQVATHPALVAPTRELLQASGLPYVIENVVGAPLLEPMLLCGSMFGLGLRPARPVYLQRHRLFESPVFMWPPAPCAHDGTALAVYGHPGGSSKRDPRAAFGSTDEWRTAMGIEWMVGNELAEAIPPAYTEWIGHALLAAMEVPA